MDEDEEMTMMNGERKRQALQGRETVDIARVQRKQSLGTTNQPAASNEHTHALTT